MHTIVQQQELHRLRILWVIQRMARSLEAFSSLLNLGLTSEGRRFCSGGAP